MIDNKNTEVTEPAVEEAPVLSLTVQDLATLRSIIDVASKRGAFQPTEFSLVGDAYNKLNNFIAAVAPPNEIADGQAPDSAEAEVETGE